MNPPTSVPVVSVMYLPTVPLAFARPFGNRDDVELSSRRAVSRALAARTTTLARTRASAPVVLSTYATPVARPLESTSTSRAIAFVTRVSRSEEHTSELQSRSDLVCRLLLEKKKKKKKRAVVYD